MKISNSEFNSINLDEIFPVLDDIGLNYEFLLITPTGYNKSIMDATTLFRSFLKNSNLHDYDLQKQGPKNKKFVKTCILTDKRGYKTKSSLYRPDSKNGDPRIWVYKLTKFCNGGDTLLFLAHEKTLFLINLSNKKSYDSLVNNGTIYHFLKKFSIKPSMSKELLDKIQTIHDMGFVEAIGKGDPAVGETLEYYLNIKRNNDKNPDYMGNIELKAKEENSSTRDSIFTQVPDWKNSNGMDHNKLLERFGYCKEDSKGVMRLNLHVTLRAHAPNRQGLYLDLDYDDNILVNKYKDPKLNDPHEEYILQWDLEKLKKRLLQKHPATFWVVAESKKDDDGKRFFRYKSISFTKNPNVQAFPYLIDEQYITVDYLLHKYPNKTIVDKGVPFKIKKSGRHLLFGEPVAFYDLDQRENKD